MFVEEASKTFQRQMTKAYDSCCIGALRVDKCEFQLILGHDFHEMLARLRGSHSLLIMSTDILSWADELAEPRPDMNIKVTAFTVTQMLNYSCSKLIYCTF